ncbi:unnamed protein product [Caenorhabditis angaria]|uniref:Uncharacterized protein n=1 Tax=Caenorhabditis angaria TaxID=860376 RepID=A0A9P1N3M2_9PELO|nr:unnamed protein product [Caenorhabditis angaria]
MPREMLLILKTNDLMRNIEHKLGLFGYNDANIEMTRCVVRSSHELSIRRTENHLKKFGIYLKMYWQLLKISIFQQFLSFGLIKMN